MRKITTIAVGTASALGLGLALAGPGMAPAMADTSPPVGTTTTFSVTGGDLTLTAQSDAPLGSVLISQASVSGSLGQVEVNDQRGVDMQSWEADVVSTPFVNGSVSVPPSSVTYTPGEVATTGSASFAPGPGTVMTASQIAYKASSIIGVNDAQWTPHITIALPANRVAGDYSGTITHSVG